MGEFGWLVVGVGIAAAISQFMDADGTLKAVIMASGAAGGVAVAALVKRLRNRKTEG